MIAKARALCRASSSHLPASGCRPLQRDGGEAEAADGDDLEIGGIEDQRPAPHIDHEGHFLPRILRPPAHAVGIFHAVERGETRRCAQGDDAAFDLGAFRFRQLVAQPVERQHAGDRGLGRALQADGLLAALEEIIPALVGAQAVQRQFRDPQLGGVALQHVGQGRLLENLADLQEVIHQVLQPHLLAQEFLLRRQVGREKGRPQLREPRQGEIGPDAGQVFGIEKQIATRETGGFGGRKSQVFMGWKSEGNLRGRIVRPRE
jgi:hypothetical protein